MVKEKLEPQITQKPVETAEVVAEIQPVEEKPTKPWLKIALFSILGIILASGLVFAGYKFGQKQVYPEPVEGPTPTPLPSEAPAKEGDPTANWKTYTSSIKDGFTIKYPSEIIIEEKTEGDYEWVGFVMWGPTQKSNTELYDGIILRFASGLLGGKTLKELVDKEVEQSKENADILISRTTINVGGVVGYTYRVRGLGEHTYIFLPMKSDRYIYIINSTSDPTGQGFQETVDLMLSTFKFLE